MEKINIAFVRSPYLSTILVVVLLPQQLRHKFD